MISLPKIALTFILLTGTTYASSSYFVEGSIESVFRHRSQDVQQIATELYDDLQRSFVQTCDPTNGEEAYLSEGCQKVHEVLKSELVRKDFTKYVFGRAKVEAKTIEYTFVRPLSVADEYGCQLRINLVVKPENILKSTKFDLYCDG